MSVGTAEPRGPVRQSSVVVVAGRPLRPHGGALPALQELRRRPGSAVTAARLSAMKAKANDMPGPIAWRVVWGRSVTTSFVTEVVEAYDADEAMVEGSRRHPELLRPNFALPIDPSHKTYGD